MHSLRSLVQIFSTLKMKVIAIQVKPTTVITKPSEDPDLVQLNITLEKEKVKEMKVVAMKEANIQSRSDIYLFKIALRWAMKLK